MQSPSRPRWATHTKVIVVLLILAGAIYLLVQFKSVIPPIILSVILAYILYPLVTRIQDTLHLPRALSVLLAYVLVGAVIAGLLTFIIPYLVGQVTASQWNFDGILQQITSLLGKNFTIWGFTIDGREITTRVVDTLQQILSPVVGHTITLVTGVVSSLVWVIFILIITFYLLKDSRAIGAGMERLVPPEYRQDYNDLRLEIGDIWSAFFRGQMTLSLMVMAILTVLGYAIGLPYALPMGVLGGLLEFLPSIGHGIWLVLAGLLALIFGSTWIDLPHWAFLLIVVGAHILFTQTDLNYLIPRVIGRRVRLVPLVVILGIVAGAALAGVLGVVLAAPTIATARVLGRYIYARLFEMEAFDDPTTQPLPPPEFRWWRKYRNRLPRRMPAHPAEAASQHSDSKS